MTDQVATEAELARAERVEREYGGGTAAREARDEAMGRVERNADEEWAKQAKRALAECIQTHDFFTTDDITGCPEPREPRAWGPILRAAAVAGYIENTGTTRQSAQVACHARPKTVWRVLKRVWA